MRTFKLVRRSGSQEGKAKAEVGAKFDAILDARLRIQAALDELSRINTKSEIEEAEARGVAFSHEGFAKRIHVGTDTLRRTNSDLFEILVDRLGVLERIAGRPLRGQAAKGKTKDAKPGSRKRAKAKEEWEKTELDKARGEIERLTQLLENAQDEILDLTAQLDAALQVSDN
jgi:molecular chaperone GrpE (heat shock protein)